MQSDNPPNKDPIFIEESKQFILLKESASQTLGYEKKQPGHITLGLDLLKQILHHMYGSTDIITIIDKSVHINEAEKCSAALRTAIEKAGWSKSTARTGFSLMKRILEQTSISREFLKRLSIKQTPIIYRSDLGKKYGSLPNDNPIKIILMDWVQQIKINTRNKSDESIRRIIRFYINQCLPALSMNLECMPTEIIKHVESRLNAGVVKTICGDIGVNNKKTWLTLLHLHIFKCKKPVPDEWFTYAINCDQKETNMEDFDDGSDKHTFKTNELEVLYKATEDDVLNRLIYLLLLTTGMRIGGLARIKTEHVAHIAGKDAAILDTGRTIEKGKKWFTFIIAPLVKQYLFKWITCLRPSFASVYLFPGNVAGHMSTCNIRHRFSQVAKKAGLKGMHVHPHALRHTYAHMMLKMGNPVATVASLLGHASSKTTEQFYLKESSADVAQRSNIPWLDKNNAPEQPIVPSFLIENTSEKRKKTKDHSQSKERKKQRRAMAAVTMFSESSS